MGKTGRLHPPGFKEEAVRLVHSSDEKYPISKIARDLDVVTESLRKWVSQTEIGAGDEGGLSNEEKGELCRLRREVKVLREEREILKKRRPSSLGRRTSSERAGDLRVRGYGEGQAPGKRDVHNPEGLQERLLRLERQTTLCTSEVRCCSLGEDRSHPQRQPRDLHGAPRVHFELRTRWA